MDRNDRLDASLAKHFAWSFAISGSVIDLEDRLRAARVSGPPPLPPAAAPVPVPVDEAAIDALRDRMRKACRPLLGAIEKAWALAEAERVEGRRVTRLDAGDGAKATKRLLVRAERLDHVLAGLDAEPVLAVRMARLFVRYGAAMNKH
ncbi:MAG: hypothetical protein ACRENE_25145, partial [Polyangiaceae bacterium]